MAKETIDCPICNKSIPEKDFDSHMKMEAKKKSEGSNENNEPQYQKIGNRDLAKMIDDSDTKYITIRVLYLDNDEQTSANGDFRRAVIEPVDNCKFERTAWLIGSGLAVGKRLNKSIPKNEELLTNQFELQLINNVVGRSRPFVDINDIYVRKLKQLTIDEVEEYFPNVSGVNVRKE